MEEQQRQELVSALHEWAKAHPAPNVPVLIFGSSILSPSQMAEAVEKNNDDGMALCELFESAAEDYSWKDVLSSLRRESHQPHAPL
jgi:late competence protein required for DNA uptake (superfamily II DNA/RNA helicase)